eukprot:805600-Pelagomonas_calceolata.AAC.2
MAGVIGAKTKTYLAVYAEDYEHSFLIKLLNQAFYPYSSYGTVPLKWTLDLTVTICPELPSMAAFTCSSNCTCMCMDWLKICGQKGLLAHTVQAFNHGAILKAVSAEQLASACLIPPYGCLHHINKQAPFSFPNKGYKGYKGLAYSPRIWLIGFPNYIYV